MMNEQSDSQYMFMTDEQIAAYERKQADIRASLMTAFPEQKSDKELVQQLRADNARLMEELAAAQATIAEMRKIFWRDVSDELPTEAQEVLFVRDGKVVHGAWINGIFWHSNEKMAAAKWMPFPPVDMATPTNLDALHEARAVACERLKGIVVDETFVFSAEEWRIRCEVAERIAEEAAAHRARKEGK